MASDPKWYDADDVLLAVAPILAGSGGTPSATPVTLRLYNDKDEAGADALPASQVFGYARLSSSGLSLTEGHPLVDRRMVEARIAQGLGGKVVTATAWQPLGVGRFLEIPTLTSGEGVELEFQLNAPSDADGFNALLSVSLAIETAIGIGLGFHEAIGNGVYLGIGDPLVSAVLEGAPTLENPAAADDEIQVGPFTYIVAGIPLAYAEQLVAIAASTATFSRYVLLSLADDATLTLTDGVESDVALTDDDEPAAPAGEQVVARVIVDDSGVISQADIEDRWQRAAYYITHQGLNATVGPGRSLTDNAYTFNQVLQSASLTASSTNHLWLTRQGALAVTVNGVPPAGTRAMLLATLVTDAGAVTAFTDYRRFIGHRLHILSFDWLGALTVADYRYAINPSDRPAYILPIGGLRAALAVGGTVSGSTRFEIEIDEANDDVWVAITDPDSAPEIAFDATDLRSLAALPASFLIPPGARIRVSSDVIPGGADSSNAHLDLLLVEV